MSNQLLRKRTARLTGCLVALFWGLGCAGTPDEEPELGPPPTAETFYEQGLEVLEGERFMLFFRRVDHDLAVSHFQEVIDNYPYSDYTPLAELRIADIHFRQHKYEEARSYYQDFVELHPNHERVAYAIYRNGLCSFERIRAVDRDQEPTHEAIQQFRSLLERHPESDYAVDAERRLREAEERLAEQALQIADFYYEQGRYHAALERYKGMLLTQPYHPSYSQTIARVGLSLARLHHPRDAAWILRQSLRSGLADPDLREQVEAELVALADQPVAGENVLSRSCWVDPNPACAERGVGMER